eukprot:NODE_2673_length_484_cov_67.225287_g2128_i0.p2 GENE.NODE_2673_length_484_cov_67.225287_g2128_i0~~NODE_2673_length_484_cov_67.225287_g2128_i0.p2  ORF type:complete len:105 (-),score=27.35 NODE_2673_length_484_cov_67.225287_g2128_i0:96-410(-)
MMRSVSSGGSLGFLGFLGSSSFFGFFFGFFSGISSNNSDHTVISEGGGEVITDITSGISTGADNIDGSFSGVFVFGFIIIILSYGFSGSSSGDFNSGGEGNEDE